MAYVWATLLSLAGLWFTHWVVTAPDTFVRVAVPEPIFSDVPDTTFDTRGMT